MSLPAGINDLVRTFKHPRLIFYLAWSDIRARYKRSVLGPLWITLGTSISVVGLGFIWSELFKIDRAQFIPMLTVGLILWQYISVCIVESSGLFSRQANILRNLNLPIGLHPAQLLTRHLFNLLHNMPLYFVVVWCLDIPLKPEMLMAIPGLILVTLNLFWMSLLFGIIGARFKDFEYLVAMIMPLLMFLSPVMYRPNALPTFGEYIWYNPLADMIELIRYPLLGEVTPNFVYQVNFGMLAVGGILTLLLFNAKRNRIVFWV